MFNNIWSTQDEGAVGGEPVDSQEGNDDRTKDDLLLEIHQRDQWLNQQQQEIENLKSQLNVVMNLMKLTAPSSSPITTCTVTTTISSISQPKVVFSSAWSKPIFTQPGVGTNPKMGNANAKPSQKPIVTPGVSSLISGGRKPGAIPDLIRLDDSSGSDSGSASSIASVGLPNQNQGLSSMVQMLGRHSCPKPEVYSLESGRSFSRFLQSFEAYCEGKYSSAHKDLWTSELGRFLDGEIKQVYDACGGPEKKYRKMKNHLESWHSGAKERITSSRRSQYRSAKILPNEKLLIFATRLENLYKMAYPNRALDGKDLKRQLVSAIPVSAAETLERDLALVRATTGRQNTWGDVLRLLEIQDESSRRGSATPQFTVPSPSQTWAGAVHKNLAMRVETGTKPKQKYQPPREKSKSPQRYFSSPGRRQCNWCKRLGHEYKNCRRRLNQCLRCGSDEHRISDCPVSVQGVRRRSSSASSSAGSDSGQRHGRSPRYHQSNSQGNTRKKSSHKGNHRSNSSSRERSLNLNPLV